MRYKRRKKHAEDSCTIIPDNTEPWLSTPPRTVGDLITIADNIVALEAKWKKR